MKKIGRVLLVVVMLMLGGGVMWLLRSSPVPLTAVDSVAAVTQVASATLVVSPPPVAYPTPLLPPYPTPGPRPPSPTPLSAADVARIQATVNATPHAEATRMAATMAARTPLPTPGPIVGPTRIVDEGNRFSLQLPAGWFASIDDTSRVTNWNFGKLDRRPRDGVLVDFARGSLTAGQSFSDWVRDFRQLDMSPEKGGYGIAQSPVATITVGTYKGVSYTTTGPEFAAKVISLDIGDSSVFVISVRPMNVPESVLNKVDAILQSIQMLHTVK